jgi:hypothetical protein
MTEREALEECRDLWQWIADTVDAMDYRDNDSAGRLKATWPGWRQLGLEDEAGMHNYCPACIYSWQKAERKHTTGMCQHCPLMDLWTGGKRNPSSQEMSTACLNKGSVYMDFSWLTNKKSKVEAARKISDFCKDRLEGKHVETAKVLTLREEELERALTQAYDRGWGSKTRREYRPERHVAAVLKDLEEGKC